MTKKLDEIKKSISRKNEFHGSSYLLGAAISGFLTELSNPGIFLDLVWLTIGVISNFLIFVEVDREVLT